MCWLDWYDSLGDANVLVLVGGRGISFVIGGSDGREKSLAGLVA
jgi:hypothetical protein